MLLWLTQEFADTLRFLNVFSYLTMRAILAALSALAISLLIGPWMIARLSRYQIGQVIREEGPQTHFKKAGTPTMGGLLILVAILASTLLWADLRNRFVWVVLGVTALFGLVGFWDDYLKLIKKNSKGLIARYKYFWQSVGGLAAALVLWYTAKSPADTTLYLPCRKNFALPLVFVGVVWLTYLMIVVSPIVSPLLIWAITCRRSILTLFFPQS